MFSNAFCRARYQLDCAMIAARTLCVAPAMLKVSFLRAVMSFLVRHNPFEAFDAR
jgi:hypothetical protein